MRTSVSINELLSDALSTMNDSESEFFHRIIIKYKALSKKTTLQENTFLRV